MQSQNTPNVIIIGAGFGGIITAIGLKDKLNFDNFEIIEKASDVGGTWRENTYPGASSDVAIHFYSLSTDLKHDWDYTYGEQPYILGYIQDVVRKRGLRKHIRFNTKVVNVEWDAQKEHWVVAIEDVKTKERTIKTAKIVIAANGILHEPQWPNIEGLNSFKGTLMHSAQWKGDVDLRNKKVAVIGTGSSACQLIPRISAIEGCEVTQFVRESNWYFPSDVQPMSQTWKNVLNYFPILARLFRLKAFLRCEFNYLCIFRFRWLRALLQKVAVWYIKSNAPEKYHKDLIPSFSFGARRIIYDYGYIKSLNRPNMQLRKKDLKRIEEDGIVTENGTKLPFDIIVCATGFVTNEFMLPIKGAECTMQEYEKKHEGPTAYMGTTFPGFPNLCRMTGPNSITGHTSVLFFDEVQIDYMTKLIKPVLEGEISSFEVTQEACDVYNKGIQERVNSPSLPFSDVKSAWYRVGGTGKNASVFPGSALRFWWYLRKVEWADYRVGGASKDWSRKKGNERGSLVIAALVGIVAAGLWYVRGATALVN